MSTAEEQELMARIGNLAGRINRHKAEQNGHPSPAQPHAAYSSRGSYRVAPYPSRGYRGGRGRGAPTYRNRTLVLNGQSRPATTSGSASASTSTSGEANPTNATPGGPSWVARTDRHLQLINSSVYEKESQNRAAAIEQTLRQKQLQKNMAERNRVTNFLNRTSTAVGPASSNNPSNPTQYELVVDGIRFHVIRQGSKLVRVPGDNNSASTTPRVAVVGGVKFYRTRNGNLVRHGIAKAQRMAGGIKKVDEPCKTFSWTGIFFSKTIYDIANLALFCRLWCGSCLKGPQCRYTHDPAKVAVCRDWLLKDNCQKGDACDLSHEATEKRMPLCLHFANGNCRNDNCPYTHAEHSQSDPVCRAFGFCGWCSRGAKCPDRHVFECPDFSNTGVCKARGCKYLHRERASMMRKAGNKDAAAGDKEASDVSSDDDEGSASDDLDSDEVEEFIGKDETDGLDFAAQNDYIGF